MSTVVISIVEISAVLGPSQQRRDADVSYYGNNERPKDLARMMTRDTRKKLYFGNGAHHVN